METALLGAASVLPYLVVAVPAGIWIDRTPHRRTVLLLADVARALLLLTVPLLWWSGHATTALLFGVMTLLASADLVFDLAWPAFLARAAPGRRLPAMLARMAATGAVAQVAGPALAGGLIRVVGAPLALVVDALSYLASITALLRVRPDRPSADVEAHVPTPSIGAALRETAVELRRNTVLRLLTLDAVVGNVALTAATGQALLFQRRELGIGADGIGLALAVGALGTLIASATYGRIAARFGLGHTLLAGAILTGVASLLLPAALWAPPELRLPLVVLEAALSQFFLTLYAIPSDTLLAHATPDRVRGRALAASRTLSWGVGGGAGYFLGGLLAETIGLAPMLALTAVLCAVLSAVFLGRRAIRTVHALPDEPAPDRVSAGA